jgi:hypothetical protein
VRKGGETHHRLGGEGEAMVARMSGSMQSPEGSSRRGQLPSGWQLWRRTSLCVSLPHLLFIELRDGAHQPVERPDTPDQGTIKALTWSLDRVRRRSTNRLHIKRVLLLGFSFELIILERILKFKVDFLCQLL